MKEAQTEAHSVLQDEQALSELNQRWGEAERNRDSQFLADVLADDLIFRRANGARVGKRQFLDDLLDPANTFERLEAKDIEVLMHGQDTALVSLRVEAKGRRGTKDFEGTYRNTRLFRKQDGRWRCVLWLNTTESPGSAP